MPDVPYEIPPPDVVRERRMQRKLAAVRHRRDTLARENALLRQLFDAAAIDEAAKKQLRGIRLEMDLLKGRLSTSDLIAGELRKRNASLEIERKALIQALQTQAAQPAFQQVEE